MLATAGMVAHCIQAEALLDGIAVGHLLADRGYDTNRVLATAREYDAESCQALHLAGNGFGKLKARRRAMRRMRLRTWCCGVLWAKII